MPAINHPLPPRPTTSHPPPARPQGLPSPGLSLPRPPFYSSPQPASPRPSPSNYLSYQASSPKVNSRDPLPVEEPLQQVRKALDKDQLKPNCDLLELGQGWKVHWRAWRGPPLLSSASNPAPTSSKTDSSTTKYDPLATFATNPSSAAVKGADPPPAKRPKPTAFDEMMAEVDEGSVASTSTAPPLKDKLQSLQQLSFAADPVELARKEVLRLGQAPTTGGSGGQLLGLFGHVRVAAGKGEHGKGKGKEKERIEDEEPAARMLWVFSLRRGTQMGEGSDGSSRAQLSSLEFPDLTCVGKGHFSHHDLFPTLYPEATSSGSTTSSHHAPYVSPSTLSASSFPSTLSISNEFHSDLAPAASSTSTGQAASQPQSRIKAPFEAFLAAASEALTVALLTDDTTTSRPRHTSSSTRLDSSVVYLPPPSESFGSTSRRVTSDAVKISLHLSLQRTGILIQSTIEDLPYRPYPISSPPPPNSPLLLAPFNTAAQFVKTFPAEAKRGAVALAMEEEWKGLLEGTGLRLSGEEAWVLCRIELPSSTIPPTPDKDALPPPPPPPEPLEVVWPASLCILDGTKPQPSRSPDNTPPRMKAPELAPGAPPSPSNLAPTSTTASYFSDKLIVPPLDTSTRRRFASVLRRGLASTTDPVYRDPISSRAERVGSMLEEQAEERQRREQAEKAAEAALKAAPVAVPPTPSSMETSKAGIPLPSVAGGLPTSTSMAGGGAAGLAGAPINMRTPISLGGSSTEAPSPADGFGSAERGLMQALGAYGVGATGGATTEPVGGTKNAEMDHLYPSPSEAMGGGVEATGGAGSAGGDQPMSAAEPQLDHSFPDFDWGDDFATGAMGGRSNMPGQGQDFDDGMMMGLTDDDFSFFDDPPPLPVSLPMNTFGGLQSSGPSPKFVDHFSHLTGTTPFASAASPTSPFGHPSPHQGLHNHASPNLVHFGFDPSQNALGLGSTPAPLHGEGYSPFKTPRTPYSPFVEITDDHETPAGFPAPTVSIAGTPANSLLPSSRRPGKFDAIHFGNSHALCDDKYDPRKGKFGLPSPDWERDQAAAAGASSSASSSATGTDRRPLPLASAPWFTTVCDPRVAAANALKRKRTPSLAKLAVQGRKGSSSSDQAARVRSREWITQDVDSEYGEDESEDEAMDVEEASALGAPGDDTSLEDHYVGGVPPISYTFGAALLLLRQHLGTLLAGKKKAPGVPVAITKALQAADTQLEQALSLVADQTMYNPDFRQRSTSASLLKSSTTCIVSPHAIQLVGARLASLTSKSTAAITPTLKETALPSLAAQRTPAILLRAQQSIMELSTAATAYWRPMGFEPLAGGKDVTAFAIYEEGGAELNAAVAAWLKMVGEAYEGSRLGKHTPGSVPATSTFAGVQDGLGVVPVGALSAPRSRDELNGLASHLVEATRSRKHVVVYLLAPSEAYTSSPASPIVLALQQVLKIKSRASHVSWVTYPLPLSSISRWRTIVAGDSSTKRLDHLAFSVYDQLLVPVSSLVFPMPETFPSANLARPQSLGPPLRLFQSPAITMSPSRDANIEFELNWPPSSLEVMHRHRLLHIAYACSPAHSQERLEWIVVSCVDEKGEIWKTVPKLLRYPPGPVEVVRARVVWSICKMLIDTADVEWRVIISKLGVPSKAEAKAWDSQLKEALAISKRPLHVSLVGVDTSPPVSVLQQQRGATPSSPSVSQTHSEEGEVAPSIGSTTSTRKPPHLDTQPSVFAFTPAEPLAVGPDSNLIAPASTYLIHVPRIASLAHTSIDPFMSSSPLVSVLGLHFLMAHHSKASSLSITLGQHVQDVRQSFVELAALGQTRWGTSGRMAWHLEAARVVLDLVEEVEGERSA